jgi:hypothetical protein
VNNENRANLSSEQLVFLFGNINLPLTVNGVLFPRLKLSAHYRKLLMELENLS